MKKSLIIIILSIVLLLAACSEKVLQPNQPVCNKPYLLVGAECCLDKDDNSICDRDESAIVQPDDKIPVPKKLPPEQRCSEMTFHIVNVCSVGPVVKYRIQIGNVPIESFNMHVSTNGGDQVAEIINTTVVLGGDANTELQGQVRPGFDIFSRAEFVSNPCGISESYGPGFPGILNAC